MMREIIIRNTPLTKGNWVLGITTSIVIANSALYEIIEWSSTKLPTAAKETKPFVDM